MSNKKKPFVGNLAIDIVKFPDFRLFPYKLLRFYALIETDSLYSKTYRSILISDIPGHYKKDVKQYLEVKYTLRGKQEVLKNIPVGAYPIIYKNQNETWIAISEENKYVSAVITDLGEIDKKFPSTIFDLAFLIVNPNDVEYWEVETLHNREFPIYFRCGENCYWMPLEVLKIIKELFVKIMEDERLLKEIQLAKVAQMALDELKKGLNVGPTTYDKLEEIKKRLNSEEYINEIMSTLEKLERENQEYKLFNEEAKNYHYFILEGKYRYLAEAKKKARVYFKPSETFKKEKDLPEGIYLLIANNIQDGKTYYIKYEEDGWSVVEITESRIAPPVLFELAYVIKLEDAGVLVITKLPSRKFYLYLFCGLDKPCNWMPPVVFNAIWPVFRKHIKKIMQEVLNVREEKEEEMKEKVKEEIQRDKNTEISQDDEEDKRIKETILKGVITTLCWWPKYISSAYLVPKIEPETYRYGWNKGHVHIFPKPTFLPNQIHIHKPEDIKNIPEGVYPAIRYHEYGDQQIVFAISPDTEVVFHDKRIFKEYTKYVYARPLERYGLDLIGVGEAIVRHNIVDFNSKWDNPKQNMTTYWEGVYNGLSMYYLPEVVFRHLMGEKIEPKQEPFVSEIINNINVYYEEHLEWLNPIINEYNNISIDDENMEIVEFLDLHKIPGAWYVSKVEFKIDGDYKKNAIVIVSMKEPSKIFKVMVPWQIVKKVHSNVIFITVWPDGTIGWWDLLLM
jgi:hypothetical protein